MRVYAKSAFWSFVVKDNDKTYGWAPSWNLGAQP